MLVIHVGAHKCEEAYPGYATVHWVEADPKYANLPKMHSCAALDYDGMTILYRRNVSMASSILPLHKSEKDFVGSPLYITEAIEVQCRKLDTLFGYIDLVNLLVIDVEGAELYVLAGAKELLKRTEEVKIELLNLAGYPTKAQYAELLTEFTLLEECPGHDGYWSDLRYRKTSLCQS